MVDERYRVDDAREDPVLRGLWRASEGFLTERFPSANQLKTAWEDLWPCETWQPFVRAQGYVKTDLAVFRKLLPDR